MIFRRQHVVAWQRLSPGQGPIHPRRQPRSLPHWLWRSGWHGDKLPRCHRQLLQCQMGTNWIHICWSSTKTAQITPENHLFVFSNKNDSLNSSWPLHCIRSHLNAQRCIRPPKNLIFQEVTRCHEYRANHCQLTRHLHYMEA